MTRLGSLLSLMLLSLAAMLPSSGAPRAESTLVIGLAADPTGLDPEAVTNNTSNFIMSTIYDSLIRYKPGTAEPAPGVADRWDVSADGKTLTVTQTGTNAKGETVNSTGVHEKQ